MTDAIGHRGPDGDGHHFEPGLGLGHRRLAVIDLVTGAQPMLSADNNICLIFNGEIFNFQELRQDLEQRGHAFTTHSDTEVILEAWGEWGADCVNHLTGHFAFALWDRRQETLFLARDRLGEKPLYYSILADQTLDLRLRTEGACGSIPALDRTIDPCAVEEFFALGYIAEPRTIYSNVRQLPAGTTLTLRRGQQPQMQRLLGSRARHHRQQRTEESRRCAAGTAGQDRQIATGRRCSGGRLPVRRRGFQRHHGADGRASARIRSPPSPSASTIRAFDETEYAAAVAKHYGSHHVIARMQGDEIDLVESLPAIFDEPFGDSSALPSFRLMQLARKSVTVALSGDGGDELFAGYRRYGFHAREESIRRWLPGAIRQPLFGTLANLYPQLDRAPRFLRARHTFRELSADSTTGYFWNLSVVGDETRNVAVFRTP